MSGASNGEGFFMCLTALPSSGALGSHAINQSSEGWLNEPRWLRGERNPWVNGSRTLVPHNAGVGLRLPYTSSLLTSVQISEYWRRGT